MGDEPTIRDPGRSADVRIALCLSGGGFRASFFHLGVIRFLRDTCMLGAVTDVFSVSGGSIIAGHLARRWPEYLEPDTDRKFHDASTEIIQFGRADLRGRILRRWLLFGWLPLFTRTRQFEQYFSRLYRDAELGKLPEGAPNFHFLSTSLTTGDCCVFSRGGYTILGNDGARRFFPAATDMPLSRAVAASAAFPPLFPALSLTPRQLHAPIKEISYTDRLADGGVFENTGIWALKRDLAARAMKPVTFVIVSDASAAFDWHVQPSDCESGWGREPCCVSANGPGDRESEDSS